MVGRDDAGMLDLKAEGCWGRGRMRDRRGLSRAREQGCRRERAFLCGRGLVEGAGVGGAGAGLRLVRVV